MENLIKEGIVLDIKVISRENWSLFIIMIDEQEFSTFNENIANEFKVGEPIKFSYVVKGKYKNIVEVIRDRSLEELLSEETLNMIKAMEEAHKRSRAREDTKEFQEIWREEFKKATGKDFKHMEDESSIELRKKHKEQQEEHERI